MDNSEWSCKTNTEEGSSKEVCINCRVFWELLQDEAIVRVSNLKSGTTDHYTLEFGYEARTRRIAATYARIFLEIEDHGNEDLKGRYYWMGLGAFAAKTVAALFTRLSTQIGYVFSIREATDTMALGSLWLFMDLVPWYFAWNESPASFDLCKDKRDASQFTDSRESLDHLPWSKCLPTMDNFKITNDVEMAFNHLEEIESIFKSEKTESKRYQEAKDQLLDHLLAIVDHEQRNILQQIVWSNTHTRNGAKLQRGCIGWAMPDATLVLSSDYNVSAVTKSMMPWKTYGDSRHDETLPYLKDDVYIAPLEGTIVEEEESRMKWIVEAARLYHDLMLDDNGRAFLHQELEIISGWANDTYSSPWWGTPSKHSNEGQ